MCSLHISFLLEVTKYQRRKKLQGVEGTVREDGRHSEGEFVLVTTG